MSPNIGSPFVQNLDLLLAQLKTGVVIHRPDTTVSYANPSALRMLGVSAKEITGKIADERDWHFLDRDGIRLTADQYPVNLVLSKGKPFENLEIGIFDSDRLQPTWVKVAGFPEFNAQGELRQVVISFIDISHTRNSISYEKIVANARDMILITNAAPTEFPGPSIISVNQAFTELTGFPAEALEGKPLSSICFAPESLRVLARARHQIQKGDPYRGRICVYSSKHEPLWLDINVFPLYDWQNRISHFVTIGRDISALVSREQQLLSDAWLDPLTGLLNRRGLDNKARRYEANSAHETFSLIALDLDGFKQINDRFGHEAGDKVLVEVAHIMRDTVRDVDHVARIGGEEFVILLPAMSMTVAQQIAERIRGSIEARRIPIAEEEHIMVTASLGVAERAMSDTSMDETLRRADEALYQAKRAGKNRVQHGASASV